LNSALPITIEGTTLITLEVHPDYMEVRDADEEHCYTDDGEEICCPICSTEWMTEIEGEFSFDNCEHLRFSLHSDSGDDFEVFGEWDLDSFLELVEKAREKDEEADILDILGKIHHPDIEKAMLYVWQDDPLNHPWMLWGYKSD
jgi:hypothetical protein